MYLSQFDSDRAETVERAINGGVDRIILPNIDSESVHSLKTLMKAYPNNCFGLMGLHPTHVKDNYTSELEIIFKELESGNYIGVGEIGIDLYWDKTHIQEQTEAFVQQVSYAQEHNLPFVIHARDSFNEIFDALEKAGYSSYKGIFHAFTGDYSQAQKAIELGLLLGIGGIVTFKNTHLAEVVSQVDLNHLVLETDSPYLAPTPNRGKRNESSYIPLIAEKIGQLHGVKINEVARITTENAERIFKI
jgi:TatD DNase family protein